jgi:excisionase family DNA binding protein
MSTVDYAWRRVLDACKEAGRPLYAPEVARLLGIGRSTVYRLMASGELECRRSSQRRLVVDPEAIEDYVRRLNRADRKDDVA